MGVDSRNYQSCIQISAGPLDRDFPSPQKSGGDFCCYGLRFYEDIAMVENESGSFAA